MRNDRAVDKGTAKEEKAVKMEMEELKPCPFCGRVDKLVIWAMETPFDNQRLKNWRVSCDRSGDNTGCGGSSGAYLDRKEAIAAWNRRAKC